MSTCCPERSHAFASRSAREETLFQFVLSTGLRPVSGKCSLASQSRKAGAPRPVGAVGASRTQRSAAWEREASEGLERVAFAFLVEPLARPCPVWSHAAGSMFAFGRAQRPPQHVGRRVRLRRRGIECCSPSMEGE